MRSDGLFSISNMCTALLSAQLAFAGAENAFPAMVSVRFMSAIVSVGFMSAMVSVRIMSSVVSVGYMSDMGSAGLCPLW